MKEKYTIYLMVGIVALVAIIGLIGNVNVNTNSDNLKGNAIIKISAKNEWCNCNSADVTKDKKVDREDINVMRKCYEQEPEGFCKPADIDSDGDIDILDVQCVSGLFGEC